MQTNFWQNLPDPFLILAPMEGVTDLVFRQVVHKAGAPDVFFTEFTNVSSYASSAGRQNALARLRTVETDHPIVAQIWGKNPDHFALLSRDIKNLNFQGIDLNMGCPDRHVNRAGGGAAMIRTPDLALDCIKKAQDSTDLPVSVKTRLGFSSVSEYTKWLSLLLDQNLPALTIHLRTRKEMSKVDAHFELIPKIIQLRNQLSPNTKLIINGDIKDKTQALILHKEYPEVNGFMIGRGIFSNPFCFTDKTPERQELINLLNYHLDLFDNAVKTYGERPFEPLKRFFKIYINHFPGASDIREQLMHTKTTAEVRNIIGAKFLND